MPIDLSKLKSANVITGESFVAEAIERSHAAFATRNPLRAARDPQTIVQLEAARPIVSKRSDVGMIESSTPPADLEALAKQRGFDWQAGHEERTISYWASDARGDRHGDVVDQTWKFDEYEANPIMLFSHDWERPPIGGVLSWDVQGRKSRGYEGDALRLLTLFADADVSPEADSIFRLVKAGFLKAGSVGFFPEKVIEVRDAAERKELGLADWGLLYSDNHLIEWSPCSVPANPGAHRALASAKSLLRMGDIQVIREMKRLDVLAREASDQWSREDALLVGVWRHLFPEAAIPEHKDPLSPVVEIVKQASTMISLADIGEMIGKMQSGFDDRLASIESTQQDLLQSVDELTKAEKSEPTASGEPNEADVLRHAATMMAAK